jgi:hypothetical protein
MMPPLGRKMSEWSKPSSRRSSLALWLAVVPVAMSACRQAPPGTRWILPDAFQGCVEVVYEVPGAVPLPEEEGFQVIFVPSEPSGLEIQGTTPAGRPIRWRLTTSSSQRFGEWQRVEVYYLRATKRVSVTVQMGGGSTAARQEDGSLKQLPGGGRSSNLTCFGPQVN